MELKGIDEIIQEAMTSENEFQTIDSIIKEFIQNCLDQENKFEDQNYNRALGYARATGGLTAYMVFAIQKAIYYKKLNDELLCTSRDLKS